MKKRYKKGNDILDIICRDDSGAVVLKLRGNFSDTKRIYEIIEMIVNKYSVPIKLTYLGKDGWLDQDMAFDWKK